MKEHVNFYENLKEAHIRLRGTIILYDGLPYYVLAITNHRGDGVFRMYLDEIGKREETAFKEFPNQILDMYHPDNPGLGPALDSWMEVKKGHHNIIRKKMNSPLFNRFRPFPLGMVNQGLRVIYTERQPTRKTEQGLTRSMVLENSVDATPSNKPAIPTLDIFSSSFRDCILGNYPSAEDCLKNLTDPEIENEAAAFHRNFALVRGPMGLLFLAYKQDVIGLLPNNDFGVVRLDKKFAHCKEVVQSLNLFSSITM